MAKKKQAEEKPNTQAAAAETETETTPPQAEENNQTQTDGPTAALKKELADTKDQLLRLTAEYANFRKRSDKEKGNLSFYRLHEKRTRKIGERRAVRPQPRVAQLASSECGFSAPNCRIAVPLNLQHRVRWLAPLHG